MDRRKQVEIEAFVDTRITGIGYRAGALKKFEDANWQWFRETPNTAGRIPAHTQQLERLGQAS